MVAPQPSTKLVTLSAAILSPSECPLIAVPSMNCAFVHTDATVVISLRTTFAGGVHRHHCNRRIVTAVLGDCGFHP
jgi:hypothetical protein